VSLTDWLALLALVAAVWSTRWRASHAARCVACHGVRSHPVPVALVGLCSTPVV
jgi:mono/diheme cytochrome c family protein